MQRVRPYCVAFHDSSDDDQNSHTAEVVPVMESSVLSGDSSSYRGNQDPEGKPEKTQPQGNSWVRSVVKHTARFFTSALVGPLESDAKNTPFGDPHDGRSSSSPSDNWEYIGTRKQAVSAPQTPSVRSAELSEYVAVDLREVILQYRRTPDEVYMRLILAALYFGEVAINGDVFCSASGNHDLIRILLESGKVNVEDVYVQQTIQDEIDSVIVSDAAHHDRIDPKMIEYLGVLFRVPTATITKEQVRFCQQAGFEFAKMLHDNPHVLRNLPPPRWVAARVLDICFVLDMVLTWIGFITTLLNLAGVAWMIYYWFSIDLVSGTNWTILTYVLGYVVSIAVVMISEGGRMRDYEDCIWKYPDSTLVIIPFIPVFEIFLMYVTLRYELLRDKMKYFTIRYDLYNGLSNFLIVYALFFAAPQTFLQYYFSELFSPSSKNYVGYKFFAVANYMLYSISMYFLVRKATLNFSSNSFGFAVKALRRKPLMPVDVTIRILVVMLAFYLQGNVVCCLFSLPRVVQCDWDITALASTAGLMAVLGILLLVLVLVFEAQRLVLFLSVPAIVLQVAISIHVSLKGNTNQCVENMFFSIAVSVVSPMVYMTFGCLCLSFLACTCLLMYSRLTGRRLTPPWDYYYYSLRAR